MSSPVPASRSVKYRDWLIKNGVMHRQRAAATENTITIAAATGFTVFTLFNVDADFLVILLCTGMERNADALDCILFI